MSIAIPPRIGPNVGARTLARPYMPIAVPRRSGGKTLNILNMASGWPIPVANPCNTRPRINRSILGAVALMKAPALKMVIVAMKVMRWPSTSISQELSSIVAAIVARNPVAIHCAWSSPTPKAPITEGTATLTIDDAKPIAIAAVITVAVTSQR